MSGQVYAVSMDAKKRTLDPLGLELVMFVSWLMWVLGTEPVPSGRSVSALNL